MRRARLCRRARLARIPEAQRWLANFGDPYTASIQDSKGLVGIDFGVYGVPETFVIDKQGIIRDVAFGNDELVPDGYEGWVGRLLLLGWSAALFYHLLNGIRHLFWDAGYGFELPTMQSTGYFVLIGTAVLTAIAWGLGMAGGLR